MDTTKTNINYNANYCGNRLPCGFCTLLNRPCPMFPVTVAPTRKITFDGSTGSDSAKWAPDPNVIYTVTNAEGGE